MKGPRISITDNFPVFFCDQIGIFFQRFLDSAAKFFYRGNLIFECDCCFFYIGRINCQKCFGIFLSRYPDL